MIKYRWPFAQPVFTAVPEPRIADPNYRRRSKGRGVHYTQSVYYYWFEFLRMSEKYKRVCDGEIKGSRQIQKLHRDFGNIHAYPNFRKWWNAKDGRTVTNGAYLFGVRTVETVSEIKSIPEGPNILSVAIPLDLSMADIRKQFNALLAEHHIGERGQTREDLFRKQVLYMPEQGKFAPLKSGLDLFKLRLKKPEWPIWRLGAHFDESFSDYTERDFDNFDTDLRIAIASPTHRILRRAEAYIRNLEETGKFPIGS